MKIFIMEIDVKRAHLPSSNLFPCWKWVKYYEPIGIKSSIYFFMQIDTECYEQCSYLYSNLFRVCSGSKITL